MFLLVTQGLLGEDAQLLEKDWSPGTIIFSQTCPPPPTPPVILMNHNSNAMFDFHELIIFFFLLYIYFYFYLCPFFSICGVFFH